MPDESILVAGTTTPADETAKMYVVTAGSARAHRTKDGADQTLGYFDVGEQFGANALSENPSDRKPRTVSVTAHTHLWCLVVDADALGSSFARVVDMLTRDVANRQWQLAHWGQVNFEDIVCGKTLGKGSYGHVTKALHMPTGKIYAMKTVQKAMMKTDAHVRQIRDERALMAACNHPFIARLVGGWQCKHNLYFLLELIEGGELFELMARHDSFELDDVLFYTANIAAALTHFHRLGVAHRDLKQENLMLDEDGYLKVMAAPSSKRVHSSPGNCASWPMPRRAPSLLPWCPHVDSEP